MKLSEEQKQKALEILRLFLDSGELIRVKEGEFLEREEFQELRRKISKEIHGLIDEFFHNRLDLDIFKSKVDSINKKNPLWGFRGVKGQMFFNQLYNVTKDKSLLAGKLQNAMSLPESIEDAENEIVEFLDFVSKLSIGVSNKRLVPKENSIPYFLSYFWQIQSPERFPIYYTSLEQSFTELGFMPTDIEYMSDKYIFFYNLNNELKELFTKETRRNFSYWDVEHVFWYYHNKEKDVIEPETKKETPVLIKDIDYIPPIVKEIPTLACGDEKLVKKYEKESKRVEHVLEDKIHKLFIMLGYETIRLGKGKGREPDGIAKARQESYAIIYDAKSREGEYSFGTDDRAIKEYIESHLKALKREGFRNIYFVIISSSFRGNQRDIIRKIKIETGVQEILLLRADQLIFMLELKLRDSNIDLATLQEVFHKSGTISKEEIQEYLTGR